MKNSWKLITTSLVLASCGTAKMAVSPELNTGSTEYSVKGRQGILIKQKLSFGDFATTKVKRSWTKGNSSKFGIASGGPAMEDWVNLISLEYINKKQTLNFNLTDGNNQSEVYCVSRFNSKELQVGPRPNSIFNIGLDIAGIAGRANNLFYVQLFCNNDPTPWQLVLDNQRSQSDPKRYTGVLAKSATEYYTLHPVTRMEINGKAGNILAGSLGYEIHNAEGKAVAAVSLIDKGSVVLGNLKGEERFLLANLCAAILLQENIE